LSISVPNSGVANALPANGPVTIQHRFGQTTIPAPPRRVVSAGFTEQDDLLAVGIVPIAVTQWWGDEPFEVWPWAQPKLGSAQPEVLSIYGGGFQFRPDRRSTAGPHRRHQRGSGSGQLQPALGDRANDPTSRAMHHSSSRGRPRPPPSVKRLFQSDKMQSLIAQADNRITRRGQKLIRNSAARTRCCCKARFWEDKVGATLPGWRTDFPDADGFFGFPTASTRLRSTNTARSFRGIRSCPVLNTADVLIWTTQSDADEAALRADPAFQQLNANRAEPQRPSRGKRVGGAPSRSPHR